MSGDVRNDGFSVRFFATAALRAHEEVPGEIVPWLHTSITVECEGGRPITGVWRSTDGKRRVCWYASEPTEELFQKHVERYEDEPYWIIDRSAAGSRRIRVIECDPLGHPQVVRQWEFDAAGMPAKEEERTIDGGLRATRTYRCTNDGEVFAASEQRPGVAAIEFRRPIEFPVVELAGEPFPCGGTIGREGPRLIEAISVNSYQGRLFAAYRDGGGWRRGLATMATSKAGWVEEMRPILEFEDPKIPRLIHTGALVDRRHDGYSFFGVVEALPGGRTLDDVVRDRALSLGDALRLAIEIADVAHRAHARGHQLGGIRPELVYVVGTADGYALSGVAHRGPAVISTTYSGEQIKWPPVFPCDFSSPDDTRGLAQLVWYALTSGHPYLAADDLRWDPTWNEFRHKRRRRQAWAGPKQVGGILERVLFEERGAPDFEALVRELEHVRSADLGDM